MLQHYFKVIFIVMRIFWITGNVPTTTTIAGEYFQTHDAGTHQWN